MAAIQESVAFDIDTADIRSSSPKKTDVQARLAAWSPKTLTESDVNGRVEAASDRKQATIGAKMATLAKNNAKADQICVNMKEQTQQEATARLSKLETDLENASARKAMLLAGEAQRAREDVQRAIEVSCFELIEKYVTL
jgi:hypothetical protein